MDWHELSKDQRNGVWSLVCQLLHFAAAEYPDEFRRRRDGIAELLFSPQLSGRSVDWDPAEQLDCSSPEPSAHGAGPHPSGLSSDARGPAVISAVRKVEDSGASLQHDASISGAKAISNAGCGKPVERRAQGRNKGEDEAYVPAFVEPRTGTTPVAGRGSSEGDITLDYDQQKPSGKRPSSVPSRRGLCEPKARLASGHDRINWKGERQRRADDVEVIGVGEDDDCLREDNGQQDGSATGYETKHKDEPEGDEELGEQGNEHLEDWTEGLEEENGVEGVLTEVQCIKDRISRNGLSPDALLVDLRALRRLTVSIEVLQATKIGKVVKGVAKSADGEAQALAKLLVREWTALVSEAYSPGVPAAGTARGREPGTGTDGAAPVQLREDAQETRDLRGERPVASHGEDGEGVAAALPAPPLDECAFQMSALDVSTCLTDLDSMESELSGSVGSAGGQSNVATKTPESHRLVANSDSSPCETNRPHPAAGGGPRGSASCVAGRPASVLSSQVRKSGWADCEGGREAEEGCFEEGAGGEDAEEFREQEEEAIAREDVLSNGRAPSGRGIVGAGAVRRGSGDQRTAGAQVGGANTAKWDVRKAQHGERSNLGTAAGAGRPAPKPGGNNAFPRPVLPRPSPPPFSGGGAGEGGDRLELAKRKLQDKYQSLGEAKKARTIQVVPADTKRQTPAGRARPPGNSGRHGSLGGKLGLGRPHHRTAQRL